MCVCVCVWCVLFLHLFQDDLRCLFRPHQVNHGGVQKTPTQVSLYKSHTTEVPLRRNRSDRYCHLLTVLSPTGAQRVVEHLLDFNVLLRLTLKSQIETFYSGEESPSRCVLILVLSSF